MTKTKTKYLDRYIDNFIDDIEKMTSKKEVKAYIKKIIITSGIFGSVILVGFSIFFNKGDDEWK